MIKKIKIAEGKWEHPILYFIYTKKYDIPFIKPYSRLWMHIFDNSERYIKALQANYQCLICDSNDIIEGLGSRKLWLHLRKHDIKPGHSNLFWDGWSVYLQTNNRVF